MTRRRLAAELVVRVVLVAGITWGLATAGAEWDVHDAVQSCEDRGGSATVLRPGDEPSDVYGPGMALVVVTSPTVVCQ